MPSRTFFASAVALSAAALAAPASGSVSDFRLPTDRPQQEPPPDLQGPVAPDVPASRRVPAAPTPTPTASRPESPSPAASPPPVEIPAGLQARPTAASTRQAAASPPPSAAPVPGTTAVADGRRQPEPSPATSSAAAAPTLSPAAARRAERDAGGWSWLWLFAAVPLLLAALVLAGRVARRWVRRPIGPVAAPQIERPRVGPPAEPHGAPTPAEPLQVSLEPLRLSLTLMNATLAYRLALANRGPTTLTGLAIGADMIAAHASMSREEQLSGPRAGSGGNPAQRIERLEPGETRVIEGEFRLPFPQIVPIRQGNAALLLPLARFRVEADGAQPLVRTFVVGQPGEGSSLQPFRLDQGPRVYPRLTQHVFA